MLKVWPVASAAWMVAACQPVEESSRASSVIALPTFAGSEVVTTNRTGTLRLAEQCVLFRDQSRGLDFLPIWPAGSRLEGSTVIVGGGGGTERQARIGARLTLQGSTQDWANVPASMGLAEYQARCRGTPFFVSFVR